MSQNSTQVQVPVSLEQLPIALNLARYLKGHPILKERLALLENSQEVDMFRFKRLGRLLTSDEYKKAQTNPANGLPPIESVDDLNSVFVILIQNQLILPVTKLHYADIKMVRGWKPNREKPTLRRSPNATTDADQYYAWRYTKPNPLIVLYSILAIVGVFALILFPLWPLFMKVGVWYLSMLLLALLGLLFATGIVRFIIYLISLVAFPQPFWLFPNLFADCGFFESFKPLYEWEVPKKNKKGKQYKKKASKEEAGEGGGATSSMEKSSTDNNLAAKRKVTLEEVED